MKKPVVAIFSVAAAACLLAGCGASGSGRRNFDRGHAGTPETVAATAPAAAAERGGDSAAGYAPAPADARAKRYSSPEQFGASGFGAEELNTEEYNRISEQGFVSPLAEPLSTFSTSVDTASYSLVRSKLRNGGSVSPDMVRLEEFVNYFEY
ncbi:MAG: von Willebrand factor type A domain-containing protein, partial [Clostridiales bacterium]|nr:von Willebrand factor type A domain-containing protein [Clostridiales bacterium]